MTPSHGDPMSSMSMSKDMDNVDGGFKHEFYIILFSISLRDVIQNPLTNSYFSRWAHCTTNQLWFMVEVNGNSKPTNITGGTLPCRIEKGQFASIPLYRIDCSIFLIFLEVAIGRVLKSWIFFM